MERHATLSRSRFVFDMIDREYWRALPEYEWIHRYHHQEIEKIFSHDNDNRFDIKFRDGTKLDYIQGSHILITSNY
jgi:hypothetical protein